MMPFDASQLAPDMTPNITMILIIGVLFITGTYLILDRSITRVIIGIVLVGNGLNLLILLAGGAAGGVPIVGKASPGEMSDPLPQAMILTAIVITLAMTAFLLAMAYRSWQLTGRDDVQDDVEDRILARRAAQETGDTDTHWVDDAAASTRDETEEGEPDAGPAPTRTGAAGGGRGPGPAVGPSAGRPTASGTQGHKPAGPKDGGER